MKSLKPLFAKTSVLAKQFKFLLISLFFLVSYSSINAHGVQTAWCWAPDGENIRIYIEHWHGDSQDQDCGAGATINVSVAINGEAPATYNNISFLYNQVNTSVNNLPHDDRLPIQIVYACSGEANTYNDWGVWDFPLPEGLCPDGGSIQVTVLSANDCVFDEGCAELYPSSTDTVIVPADCPCGPGLPGTDDDGDGWIAECDCDDNDANVNPGVDEVCGNGIDDDCDGVIDSDDDDGDGVGACDGDCDDNDPTVYPGAPEICDAKDNDCDGVIPADEVDADSDGFACDDCDDNNPDVYPGAPEICDGLDNDCDGQVDNVGDGDGDGVNFCDDCDDSDPTIYAGAPELCDGIDNDCDGTDPSTELADLDGDGYAACEGDCDDNDPNVVPNNILFSDTNLQYSCGGSNSYYTCNEILEITWTDTGTTPMASGIFQFIIGYDGADNGAKSVYLNGVEQTTFVSTNLYDCNSGQGVTVNLSPQDYITNGVNLIEIDNISGCFGLLELPLGDDIYASTCIVYCDTTNYPDADGDGYSSDCDCNDNDPDVNPAADEVCDGIDNNCDGSTDFIDEDGDTYNLCTDDCDDADPNVYPGAPEICDGKDNDCDGNKESATGYSVPFDDTNLLYDCGNGNWYNGYDGPLEINWTSTNDGMTSGEVELSIGVVCSGNTARNVYLNGVLQTTITPNDMCTCSPMIQPYVLTLNPDDYISNGLNTLSIESNSNAFGLQELPQYGEGVFVNACITYCIDPDGDEVCVEDDNCPDVANADQLDSDGDGLGDACDDCPFDADNDIDGDGVCGDVDNCPATANTDQLDSDGDGLGDVCDDCPFDADNDIDGDGVCGDVDNCPATANEDQADADCDGVGDVCDICHGGDDTVDNNGDGIPDCSQALSVDDYSDDWKCGNNNNKVKLCHIPPGNPDNPLELCVSANAIPSHLANHEGDAVGPCTLCDEENGFETGTTHDHGLTEMTVYPNPATSEFKLNYTLEEDSKVNIMVSDILGNTMILKKQDGIHGANEVNFDVNQFADGVYLIYLKVGDDIKSVRFIKAR